MGVVLPTACAFPPSSVRLIVYWIVMKNKSSELTRLD